MSIVSRPANNAYRKGWDRIFGIREKMKCPDCGIELVIGRCWASDWTKELAEKRAYRWAMVSCPSCKKNAPVIWEPLKPDIIIRDNDYLPPLVGMDVPSWGMPAGELINNPFTR